MKRTIFGETQKVYRRSRTNSGGGGGALKRGCLCWNRFGRGRAYWDPNRWESASEAVGVGGG